MVRRDFHKQQLQLHRRCFTHTTEHGRNAKEAFKGNTAAVQYNGKGNDIMMPLLLRLLLLLLLLLLHWKGPLRIHSLMMGGGEGKDVGGKGGGRRGKERESMTTIHEASSRLAKSLLWSIVGLSTPEVEKWTQSSGQQRSKG